MIVMLSAITQPFACLQNLRYWRAGCGEFTWDRWGEAMAQDEETRTVSSAQRVRRTTQARRIEPSDTALVERATQVLSVVELMEADTRAVVALEPDTREVSQPVVVPGGGRALAIRPDGTRRGARSWKSGIAVWVVALLVIGGTLAAVAPLAGRLTQRAFTPRGAQLSADGSPVQLSGPWDASAGSVNALGDGGGAGPGVRAPGTAGLPVTSQPTPPTPPSHPQTPSAPPGGVSAVPVSPWPPSNPYMFVPGRPGYAVAEPNPDPYWWAFGQCTWWAQNQRSDENLKHMGNAEYWAGGATARGYPVSATPAAGATAVFQPGVQGAGGAGHVAHVVAVYPDGWFLVSEMNFYWNGGGWGRVDYRFAHAGAGVSFIY